METPGGSELDALIADARDLGLELDENSRAAFAIYRRELLDWNRRVNLTAIDNPLDVEIKHFADSLACLRVIPPGRIRLIDVGSGGGFPGVPLKIARPEIELVLVDSIGKKTAFLRHLVETLGLSGTRVLTGRAEDLGRQPAERESYDVATSRAVASLPALAELCLPLVRVGGLMIAQKKAGVDEEIRSARRAIATLGGLLRPVVRYHLSDLPEERWLIVVEKARRTPRAYPRRPGVPASAPL